MKGVVFTFDDDLLSHATVVAPVFEKYKQRCTFFLNVNPHLRVFGSPSLEEEQIISLYKKGFEIGNHTHSHALSSNCDVSIFSQELELVNAKLQSLGVCRSETFAYPGYVSSSKIEEALRIFKLARGGYALAETPEELDNERDNFPDGWEREVKNYYIPRETNPLKVLCCGLFCPRYTLELFLNDLKKCPEDGYCIFTGHLFHSQEYPDTYHADSVDVSFLEHALKYCVDSNIKILKFKDLPI